MPNASTNSPPRPRQSRPGARLRAGGRHQDPVPAVLARFDRPGAAPRRIHLGEPLNAGEQQKAGCKTCAEKPRHCDLHRVWPQRHHPARCRCGRPDGGRDGELVGAGLAAGFLLFAGIEWLAQVDAVGGGWAGQIARHSRHRVLMPPARSKSSALGLDCRGRGGGLCWRSGIDWHWRGMGESRFSLDHRRNSSRIALNRAVGLAIRLAFPVVAFFLAARWGGSPDKRKPESSPLSFDPDNDDTETVEVDHYTADYLDVVSHVAASVGKRRLPFSPNAPPSQLDLAGGSRHVPSRNGLHCVALLVPELGSCANKHVPVLPSLSFSSRSRSSSRSSPSPWPWSPTGEAAYNRCRGPTANLPGLGPIAGVAGQCADGRSVVAGPEQ